MASTVNRSSVVSNAREEELPQFIQPPPGLQQLEESDHDSVRVKGPMKVVPSFAAPIRHTSCAPTRFGERPHSFGFSKSTVHDFASFGSLIDDKLLLSPRRLDFQQALPFPWLSHLEMTQNLS